MAFGRRVATAEADVPAVQSAAGPASAIHLLGGGGIEVRQGPVAVVQRLEKSAQGYAVLADPTGHKVFINPRAVAYVGRVQAGERPDDASNADRSPGARLHFTDGATLEIVQSPGVVNQRMEEAVEESRLFAPCAMAGGQPAFVNLTAVAAVAVAAAP